MKKRNPVDMLAKRIKDDGLRQTARELKIHPSNLTHIMKGRRAPPPSLIDALGLEIVTYYREKAK